MINDASVVIGGGNWGIKEADVLGYKLINDEYYARDIDFANSTAAGTYTDSTGVVRKAPYNLVQYSEMFSDASWVKVGSTINPNVATAPNGTLTADVITISLQDVDRLSQVVFSGQSITGLSYTGSIWLKGEGSEIGKTVRFRVKRASGGTISIGFVNHTLTSEWVRVSATFTGIASNTGVNIGFDGEAGYATSFLAWGAQLVEGTEALPYFPTTTRLNVPRIDYRNADGSLSTTGRLLLEPQRTNLALYSEQFDNAYWQKDVGASVTANAATSPDGSANADRLSFISSGVAVYRSGFGLSGAHRFTIYLKGEGANIGKEIYLEIAGGTSINVTLTGSWQRFTAIADNALSVAIKRLNLGQADSVLAWGLQLEAGAYPTSYIPTTTATVTRNADLATRSGVESWIGQTQGTMFAEINLSNLSLPKAVIGTSDGTLNNRIILSFATSTSFTATVRVGGSNLDFGITIPTIPATGGNYKVALSYAANNYMVAINGILYTPTSPASVPSANTILLGQNGGGANIPLDGIAQAAIFPTRLTNSQLQSLTTL